MILIGEKINGTRKVVGEAIRARDRAFVTRLAAEQAAAGSQYLDVNAGTTPDREPADLAWLVETVQEACSLPLCLDSANPEALAAGLARVTRDPIVNSVSGECARLEGVLPLVLERRSAVILLALDDRGIPDSAQGRLDIIAHLVALTRAGGLREDQLFIDPLVTAIATGTDHGLTALETMRRLRQDYPQAHITCGLSNISFGMPLRALINRTFLAMAVHAGLDSAIADPGDRELQEAILAAEMLAGRDRHCLRFNRAYRARRSGPAAAQPG